MTANHAELGDPPSPECRYVVTLDDSLTSSLVGRAERHYTSPALTAEEALALASALTSIPVTTTGAWLLPTAGGQSVIALQQAP